MIDIIINYMFSLFFIYKNSFFCCTYCLFLLYSKKELWIYLYFE